jgi:hypothetical protein
VDESFVILFGKGIHGVPAKAEFRAQ